MLKFLAGLALGVAAAVGYVRFNAGLPAFLEAPERLRGNIISTAIESDLYKLATPPAAQKRALSVYFANRAEDAAALDERAGRPFLGALHRQRLSREAQLLLGKLHAFDAVFSQPALLAALERKHNTTDRQQLVNALLNEEFAKSAFLMQWRRRDSAAQNEDLRAWLARAARAQDDPAAFPLAFPAASNN
jgi:hypothetical protein